MVRILRLLTPLIALSAGAMLCAYKVVRAFQTGQVREASRHQADWVFRAEDPDGFAFEVAFQLAISVGLSVLLVGTIVWTVRSGSSCRPR